MSKASKPKHRGSKSRKNPDVRYAKNPMDAKFMILPRSFDKDSSPKDPRVTLPRMRQVVAFNNNR